MTEREVVYEEFRKNVTQCLLLRYQEIDFDNDNVYQNGYMNALLDALIIINEAKYYMEEET